MKIIIATDTRVIFDALSVNLLYVGQVKTVVLANSIGETFFKMSQQMFDVCLLDLDLPGAITVLPELNEYWPAMRVVSLGGERIDKSVISRARVESLKRQATVTEIADLLMARATLSETSLSRTRMTPALHAEFVPVSLSLREIQIATMLAQGLSNKLIARELSIRPGTVKNHVHNILEKLEVSNRAKVAGRLGMLKSTSV